MRSKWVLIGVGMVIAGFGVVRASDPEPAAAPAPPPALEKPPPQEPPQEPPSSQTLSEETADLPPSEREDLIVPSRIKAPPLATYKSIPSKLDLMRQVVTLPNGRWAVRTAEGLRPITVNPTLQNQLTQLLQAYAPPFAAAVVLETHSGRVLALAEHSAFRPDARGLSTQAVFPAASIFKIVTGTALLDAGLKPDTTECFHGGKRRLSLKLLTDSARDQRCVSLSEAMGKSANVVFAKLTQKHLSADKLRQAAVAFNFNRPIAFPIPTDVSLASIPTDPFELASTGAGFGDVFLSPLHGALLAAVAANQGQWRDPVFFEDDVRKTAAPRPVMSKKHAEMLTEMLEATVTKGTARRIFRERGYTVTGAVGKTGSLADRNPYRDYSWFVGFAPKDNPQVAVAAVIVNDYKWRIRATYLGREALRLALKPQTSSPSVSVPPPESPLKSP